MKSLDKVIEVGDYVRVVEIKNYGDGSIKKSSIKQGFVVSVTTCGVTVMDPKEVGEVSNPSFCEWFPYKSDYLGVELVKKVKRDNDVTVA